MINNTRRGRLNPLLGTRRRHASLCAFPLYFIGVLRGFRSGSQLIEADGGRREGGLLGPGREGQVFGGCSAATCCIVLRVGGAICVIRVTKWRLM